MRIPAIVPLLFIAIAGVTAATLLFRGPSLAGGSISSVDIDTDITASPANTATFLGSTETCASISNGASLTIDVVMKSTLGNVVEGFQFTLNYDPAILRITALDNVMLLYSGGGTVPFDFSDAVPDTSGTFNASFADFGPNSEGGNGVLSRITIQAIGTGTSALTLSGVGVSGGTPASIGSAEIRVGSACGGPTATPPATASPTPTAVPTATASPTAAPTNSPTTTPTQTSPPSPSPSPTPAPTNTASPAPTGSPSSTPTATTTPPAATTTPTPAATQTPAPSEPATVKGDGDCSSQVDSYDALAILLNAATGAPLPCPSAADTNCDGLANLADLLLILSWIGDLSVKLPDGCPAIATA
ncbi:MAG TPA: cohesin domain-containing protein [Dehalococcoidia bacterium]